MLYKQVFSPYKSLTCNIFEISGMYDYMTGHMQQIISNIMT